MHKQDVVVENLPPPKDAGKTRDQLGQMAGLSGRTMDKVKGIVKEADEPIKEALRHGQRSIHEEG